MTEWQLRGLRGLLQIKVNQSFVKVLEVHLREDLPQGEIDDQSEAVRMVRRGKRRRWRRAIEGVQSQIGVRLAPCTWLPSHTSSKAVPDLTAAISAHASRDSLNTPPAAASSKVSFPRASTEAMSTNRSCSLKEYRQMVHLSRPFHHQLGLRLHVAASPAADSAMVTGSLLANVKIFPRRPLKKEWNEVLIWLVRDDMVELEVEPATVSTSGVCGHGALLHSS